MGVTQEPEVALLEGEKPAKTQIWANEKTLRGRHRNVAGAGKDGHAGILWEGGIGFGEFAEEKHGAAIGLDFARVRAGKTEADGTSGGLFPLRVHVCKHTQRTRHGESLRKLVDVVFGFRPFFSAPRYQTENYKQNAHENEHQNRSGSDHTKTRVVSMDPPIALGDGFNPSEYCRQTQEHKQGPERPLAWDCACRFLVF